MYRFLSYFDTKNLATLISCPVKTAIGLQDDVCPPHTNIAPYNNFGSSVKELTVNPMLKHQTHAAWDREFMEFFGRNYTSTLNEEVFVSGGEAFTEIYTLSGTRVYAGPENGAPRLNAGIYVFKTEGTARKVCVR